MLSAVLRAWYPKHKSPYSKELAPAIKSLLTEVERFSFDRNNAIHAPINLLFSLDSFEFKIEPNYWWGNMLAKNLKGKDVLIEFRWYVGKTKAMYDYALAINEHLMSGRSPLPNKLSLPPLAQYQTQTKSRRKTSAKQLRLPPRSSRA
jgi:hypothetical protein